MEPIAKWSHQEIPVACDPPEEHDPLRTGGTHCIGQTDRQPFGRSAAVSTAATSHGSRTVLDDAITSRHVRKFSFGVAHAADADVRFQAALSAARTSATSWDQDHVTEFTSIPRTAQYQLAIHDESAANARAQRDHEQIIDPASGAIAPFAKCRSVRVVAEYRRHLQPVGHHPRQGNIVFPRQVRRHLDDARELVRVRCSYAYRP